MKSAHEIEEIKPSLENLQYKTTAMSFPNTIIAEPLKDMTTLMVISITTVAVLLIAICIIIFIFIKHGKRNRKLSPNHKEKSDKLLTGDGFKSQLI